MTWGALFFAIAAAIFLALTIDLFDIHAKGIDWHFFGLFWTALGLLFSGAPLALPAFRRAP